MPELNNIITGILAKYPVLSAEEENILNEWLKGPQHKEIFESVTNNESRVTQLERLNEMKTEEGVMWERFQDAYITTAPQKGRTIWLGRWPTYIAAASIVAIAVVGVKWWGKKKNTTGVQKTAIVQKEDIQPGGYKARLTLDDGRVINLDSAANGSLVQQGSVTVTNKDGQLQYQQGGKEERILYNTLSTAKGQMYATVLSDGTRLWLNSLSSVRYPVAFNGDLRQVKITGEAYFEVAKVEKKQPFLVAASGVITEVLGTHFNVNAYEDEGDNKVTLLEGNVKVRAKDNNAVIVLRPGQQAKLDLQSGQLTRLDDVDVEEAVAWRFGYFQFNETDLKTVLSQVARWYDVEIIYQGTILQKKFWGKISRSNTLNQVIVAIEKYGVHCTLQGRKLIVSS